jgi:AAA family ATP:ADP antiporter
MNTPQSDFGFLKRNFFPIHQHELKKVVPLNMLFFLVAASYGLLRCLKDSYIVPIDGGNATSALKVFVVLPLMFFAKLIYDSLSRKFNRDQMIMGLLVYFLSFLILFRFVLEKIEIDKDNLEGIKKAYKANGGLKTLCQILLINWSRVLFYFHAEAFGTFVLSVGCWSFVNSITTSEQAKRSYSTLSIGTGFATILAGVLGLVFNEELNMLLYIVMIFIFFTGVVYQYFARAISKDPDAYEIPKEKKVKKKKLGAIESIKASFRSKHPVYLFLILTLVFCYAASLTLFESVYKNLLKELGQKAALAKGLVGDAAKKASEAFTSEWVGRQLIGIGIFSLIFVFLLAAPIRRRGWRFTALVVPSTILVGSAVYFAAKQWNFLNKTDEDLNTFLCWLGISVLILIKSGKYVLFDTTKEAAYLPLDPETKLTGKSLVDGLGARVGKAGGSSYFHLPFVKGSLLVIGISMFGIVAAWMWAVVDLSRRHDTLLTQEKANKD